MKKILIALVVIVAVILVYLVVPKVPLETGDNDFGYEVKSVKPSPQAADYNPGPFPVKDSEVTRTLRSVSLEDLGERGKLTGVYHGSPFVKENAEWYDKNFYNTLASRKVWDEGTSPDTYERKGPITWKFAHISQEAPPPCDQPQPTGFDAEGCRLAANLFKDVEKTDPAKAEMLRERVRRGRAVWFKGTFGNQDLNDIHLARTIGKENMHYAEWLDTRTRPFRFTKWGLINDPDCVQGNEESNWMDICPDEKSTGVLGYRKYFRDPEVDETGKVVFDPRTSPYQEGEREQQRRFSIGHPCVQCHVSFDPTNPPANPNEPDWENLSGHIGNQYVKQPMTFLMGTPNNHFARKVIEGGRPGTIDTSANPNDFMHNPGTQNNITDFMNKRVFQHEMKDPFTGEVKTAPTFHVLKGGEDSVGDRLALIRVYINIGTCTEECWVPNFPVPGKLFGAEAKQSPMSIKQCSQDCMPWNDTDAHMPELASYLHTGGPFYLLDATDVDGTPGSKFIDLDVVPAGRKIYARECASCHSTRVPPQAIVDDKDALEKFYEGHVFGKEDFWQYEFEESFRESEVFRAKYLAEDKDGKLRPKQFAEKGLFGQDWLGNDEPTPFGVVGTNFCRAMHDNHNEGHIWEEFASETFRERPTAGTVPVVTNRMVPGVGGIEIGEKEVTGGSGYFRNISLLSVWAHAPFLHNNAIGELTFMEDGSIDYTVKGRVDQYEMAMKELLMSDDPNVEPHREPKITRFDRDIPVSNQEDGQGLIQLAAHKGTPVANVASQNPHSPLTMKCDDQVENKGHQFGINLSAEEKRALTEFLKMM